MRVSDGVFCQVGRRGIALGDRDLLIDRSRETLRCFELIQRLSASAVVISPRKKSNRSIR